MNRISPKRSSKVKLLPNSTFARKAPKKGVVLPEDGTEVEIPAKAKKPAKKRDRSYWRKAADKWFSEFIRLRDSDERGRGKCITCPKTGHWRELQCGHWITRGHEATRYDERNSSMQCAGCNYNGGQHLKHAFAIDTKFGPEVRPQLEMKARMPCKRTMFDYQFLAETYKLRVETIKEKEPEKYNRNLL